MSAPAAFEAAGWLSPGAALALPVTIAVPLLGGLAVVALRRRPNLREAASLVAGVATAALMLSLWPVANDGLTLRLWDWLPGISLVFELEPLGLLFATVAGLLWPVTTLYAIGYMRGNLQRQQTRFYFFFALAIAASLWIAFSGNLATLFIGYEVLTLSTWPLVAHSGNEQAKRGGRIYLGLLLTTSIGLLLPAIVWTAVLAGTTDFAPGGILAGTAGTATLTLLFALYLFGIGKAALFPFHRWLPGAMVAPTPVSALLHAVAVVKAGVFTVLKVAIYVFGLDTLDVTGAAEPMMWVAAVTLIGAGLVAVTRDNLKERLAYSTVSQLAYIVLAATLANDIAAAGGALHIANHAAAKITLFFCAGAVYTATNLTQVSQLDGLGRAMPWTFGAFLVASVSILGLPPLGGTWSKWLLLLGAADAGQTAMLAVLLAGTLLSLAYLVPIPVRAFFRPPAESGHREAAWTLVVPLVLTALACLALFIGADAVIAPLNEVLESP
ncbi:proton-conducting transporter transmembrane domain-containing protein [Actinomadura livida]|uniref:Multicomponent Na+:H+ antiporter subunit D n=1 Tax=Actinomadura livida TaxID=79909 RepID=A0A7W7I7Y0_9ACTN|nr:MULTISPECIES: proton-conducting transporter membrane subunit [Actinomadura]MBB4772064.1 multicomponent Na+:H+ antiporter subunit D [Actinomadura catellatispora]GGU04442.1 cation:proton antiporter [Actinomadura livida]